jgi:hypothetical protein
MSSALKELAAAAVSMISFAIGYKFIEPQEWQVYAFVGGTLLFFVIGVTIGEKFEIALVPSFAISALITALIMAPVMFAFSLLMLMIFAVLVVILILAWTWEESYGY